MIASEPVRVASTDGYALATTVFRPPATRRPRRTVLVCSAMGVPQPYYYDFAEHVADRDHAVITFDYRGIGRSVPRRLRGFKANLEDWGRRDVAAMIEWSRGRFPDAPLSIVAHSVGAQILGLAPNIDEVRDVLALGAQSGYWRHWSGRHRMGVWLLWHLLIPSISPAAGYFPSRWFGLGRDLPRDVATQWAHWGRHPDYLVGRVHDRHREGYRRFTGRLRALTASDDLIAPVPAVRAFLGFYPGARREFRLVRPEELGVSTIGHFGYFRERIAGQLWSAELDWLLE